MQTHSFSPLPESKVPYLGKDHEFVIGSDRYHPTGRSSNGYDLVHADDPRLSFFATFPVINEYLASGVATIAVRGTSIAQEQ